MALVAVDQALDADRAETPKAELHAACAYARRRRLGPWHVSEREARRERDLAALARQGYSVDTARQVIDAPSVEELEAELGAEC